MAVSAIRKKSQLETLDEAVRKYRHAVHSAACNCRACVDLLKALASLDYSNEGR